jgi:hypothetical protein
MSKQHITAEEARQIFHYNPETGVFTRNHDSGRNKAGKPTGSVLPSGYVFLSFNKKRLIAHRVAWLYFYGSYPCGFIDHINGVLTDNRISNLRVASNEQNQQNRKRAQITNSTGLLGVSRFRKIWRARITVNSKEIHLGLFKTPEEAHSAYIEAKRKLHTFCTI